MSIKKYITRLTSTIFEQKNKSFDSTSSKKDLSNNNNNLEKIEEHKKNSKYQMELVEIGDEDNPIIIIDLQGYEKCKILENYVSFMDNIKYLSKPLNERDNINIDMSVGFIDDVTIEREDSSNVLYGSGVPLFDCSNNVM